MLHTDFYTCGIAPFKERFQFLLLCYEKSEVNFPIFFNILRQKLAKVWG
jgi:hypothetical protein